jgi:hypothetical protein
VLTVENVLVQSFSTPLNQVQSRIWLMHWSLFIFFNNDNGRTQIIDLFNQDKYDLTPFALHTFSTMTCFLFLL